MHKTKLFLANNRQGVFTSIVAVGLMLFLWTGSVSDDLRARYQKEISTQVHDKHGVLVQILPNEKGAYMTASTSTARVRELTVQKEDQYFYYHLGVNPLSIVRSLTRLLLYGEHTGGSTISQQLVKNLLHHENDRTVSHKLSELLFATALELHSSKEDILTMYLSSAYFGNQIEGIEGAAQYYFGKSTAELADGEIVRLLALLSAPSLDPSSAGNTLRAQNLGKRLGVSDIPAYTHVPKALREPKKDPAMFELHSLFAPSSCENICTLSVDQELTSKIRTIVSDRLSTKQFDSVTNAAVVVIKLGKGSASNSLLALVGTPDPYGHTDGNQINMALAPRPIGSTWKPFIYGKAIEKGARPYSLIDDTEYRYEIGTGYAFYPKNYDGIYRGNVSLHYALSNSLNVPAVRALQFDGVDDFGIFMKEELGFAPLQSLDTYQLSIALGGLEMNPLLLANYFTVFPRNGVLAPLELVRGRPTAIPMSAPVTEPRRILYATTTELINNMLADRLMGVEQFGLESNLNLPLADYAVKTGTSYDYHDSWTVGYTPDVVVVVWIGNSNNKAMDLLTGARGAGKIWHDVMTLLLARGDIAPKNFDKDTIVPIHTDEGQSFGFKNDNVEYARTIMNDTKRDGIILEPHDQDVLSYQPDMAVPLRSTKQVTWKVSGKLLGAGEKIFWTPNAPGDYTLKAYEQSVPIATLRIHVVQQSL